MTGRPHWYSIVPIAIVGTVSPAHATTYLTVEQAQKLMFPTVARFLDRSLYLTQTQRTAIAKASGVPSPKSLRVWDVRVGPTRTGWLFVDRVLGKHELITYAVALDADGAVHGIEILDYRETYGDEIRDARWRQQFVGKRFGAELRLDKDIKNISGATLSCRHVTDGIKRILTVFNVLLRED